MAPQEFIFNIPFKCFFKIDADIDVETVKRQIQRFIDHWSDGRYNLERECMERDMGALVKKSINFTAYELAKNKWPGNELTEVSPGVFSNNAIIESVKITNTLEYSGATIRLDTTQDPMATKQGSPVCPYNAGQGRLIK